MAGEVKRRCDIVLCTTTGGKLGESVENRSQVVANLQPELASLNAGSLNFALFHVAGQYQDWKHEWEKDYLEGTEDYIFPNTFYTMRRFLEIMGPFETKPEFEIYDVGMINNLAHLIPGGPGKDSRVSPVRNGHPGRHPRHGGQPGLYGADRRAAHRRFSVVGLRGRALPVSHDHPRPVDGRQRRVGLEDNLYLEKGVLAKNSGEQVAKLIRIARELGIEPATPEEAREILGLKGLDKVNY